jgi:histidinol-phosphate aminotransferase
MITRRVFGAAALAGAAARMLPEAAFAQRAAVPTAGLPADTVWLNANENPAGPPAVALEAMRAALPTAGRYHYQDFGPIYSTIAHSEGLSTQEIVAGSGSSEVLHIAVDAFTSPTRPLITVTPAYEGPIETARALGRPVVLVKTREDYTADVRAIAQEAEKAKGSLVYLCNPNNPTSSAISGRELDWLVYHLPPDTQLLVDEAYIHFVAAPEIKSAMPYVQDGKEVIVTRTYSKIFGMAGMRVGFAAARPGLIARMAPLRMNVISIVSARGVVAALGDAAAIVNERRKALEKTRRALCDWLRDREVGFIQPHANFVMIDCGRPAREFISAMPRLGVVPGRPFPPLDNMLRVSFGTDAEMERFREVFWKVLKG